MMVPASAPRSIQNRYTRYTATADQRQQCPTSGRGPTHRALIEFGARQPSPRQVGSPLVVGCSTETVRPASTAAHHLVGWQHAESSGSMPSYDRAFSKIERIAEQVCPNPIRFNEIAARQVIAPAHGCAWSRATGVLASARPPPPSTKPNSAIPLSTAAATCAVLSIARPIWICG
jgi:hypothetical protein